MRSFPCGSATFWIYDHHFVWDQSSFNEGRLIFVDNSRQHRFESSTEYFRDTLDKCITMNYWSEVCSYQRIGYFRHRRGDCSIPAFGEATMVKKTENTYKPGSLRPVYLVIFLISVHLKNKTPKSPISYPAKSITTTATVLFTVTLAACTNPHSAHQWVANPWEVCCTPATTVVAYAFPTVFASRVPSLRGEQICRIPLPKFSLLICHHAAISN